MGLKNLFNNLFKKNIQEDENILEKYAQNSENEDIKNQDSKLEEFLDGVKDLKNEIVEEISNVNIGEIKKDIVDTVENSKDVIVENKDKLIEETENINNTISADIKEKIDNFKEELIDITEDEKSTFSKEIEITQKITDVVSENLNDIFDSIGEKKDETIDIISEKVSDIEKNVDEILEDNKNEEVIEESVEETNIEKNVVNVEEVESTEDTKVEKKGLFARLKEGLKKTSDSFSSKFDNLFKGYLKIDDELYEELEEILITSDISFDTTLKIVENLKDSIKKKNITDVNLVKPELKEVIYDLLKDNNSAIDIDDDKSVIIMVGVNGVGKTTTIGKLASKLKNSGKSVLLAAGDTFRAAAEEQLEIWSKRADVEIVRHQQSGADPSAVIYDAIQKAKSKDIDVLICDTAGRLHNKINLMNELSKIMRTVNKEHSDAKKEVLLVIDATTGQNALNQVKTFNEAVNLTGVILTKLDGTAKGGVILSIIDEYNIPVKFVGVGEKVDDLQEFNPRDFVDALFDSENN